MRNAAVKITGYAAIWVLSSVPFLPGILLGFNRYASTAGVLLWLLGVPVFLAGAAGLARWTGAGGVARLGLGLHAGWGRNLLIGLGLGAVEHVLILGVKWAGGASVTFDPNAGTVRYFLLTGLFTAFIGFSEELVDRGYVRFMLPQRMGPAAVAVVSAVLFMATHIPQQGAALPNLAGWFLGGVLFMTAYLLTGSLWLGIGWHWMGDWLGQTAGPAGLIHLNYANFSAPWYLIDLAPVAMLVLLFLVAPLMKPPVAKKARRAA